MIKPAILYKGEVEKKFAETFNDMKYQYFYHGTAKNSKKNRLSLNIQPIFFYCFDNKILI